MADGGGLLLLIVTGMIILRPKDVPTVARNTGRLFGFTVRAIKRARDVADETIKASNIMSENNSNSTLKAVRSSVESSMSQFSSLSTSLQREMSDVPLTPSSFIRSRLRKATAPNNIKQQQHVNNNIGGAHQQQQPPPLQSVNGGKQSSNVSNSPHNDSSFIGVDFIAKGIEEDALFRQENKIFGDRGNSESPSSSTDDKKT